MPNGENSGRSGPVGWNPAAAEEEDENRRVIEGIRFVFENAALGLRPEIEPATVYRIKTPALPLEKEAA
jgi:hypothetical protein